MTVLYAFTALEGNQEYGTCYIRSSSPRLPVQNLIGCVIQSLSDTHSINLHSPLIITDEVVWRPFWRKMDSKTLRFSTPDMIYDSRFES